MIFLLIARATVCLAALRASGIARVAAMTGLLMGMTVGLVRAGTLDDLGRSLGQTLNDTAKKAVESALAPTQGQSTPAPTAQPQLSSQMPRSAGAGLSAPGSASGGALGLPKECFTYTAMAPFNEVSNNCDNGYDIIYRKPGEERCWTRGIAPHVKEKLFQTASIVAVCIKARGAAQPNTCSCAPGLEFSAQTRPPPDSAGYPSDADGCPVEKKDPRWAVIKPGMRCYR